MLLSKNFTTPKLVPYLILTFSCLHPLRLYKNYLFNWHYQHWRRMKRNSQSIQSTCLYFTSSWRVPKNFKNGTARIDKAKWKWDIWDQKWQQIKDNRNALFLYFIATFFPILSVWLPCLGIVMFISRIKWFNEKK